MTRARASDTLGQSAAITFTSVTRAAATSTVSVVAADSSPPTPVQELCVLLFCASSVLSTPLAHHPQREAPPRQPRTATHPQHQRPQPIPRVPAVHRDDELCDDALPQRPAADADACDDEFPLETTTAEHHRTWPGQGGGEFVDSNNDHNPSAKTNASSDNVNDSSSTIITPNAAVAYDCADIPRVENVANNNQINLPDVKPTSLDAAVTSNSCESDAVICSAPLHPYTDTSPSILDCDNRHRRRATASSFPSSLNRGVAPSNSHDDSRHHRRRRATASSSNPTATPRPARRQSTAISTAPVLCSSELALRAAAFARLAREGVEQNPGPALPGTSRDADKENDADELDPANFEGRLCISCNRTFLEHPAPRVAEWCVNCRCNRDDEEDDDDDIPYSFCRGVMVGSGCVKDCKKCAARMTIAAIPRRRGDDSPDFVIGSDGLPSAPTPPPPPPQAAPSMPSPRSMQQQPPQPSPRHDQRPARTEQQQRHDERRAAIAATAATAAVQAKHAAEEKKRVAEEKQREAAEKKSASAAAATAAAAAAPPPPPAALRPSTAATSRTTSRATSRTGSSRATSASAALRGAAPSSLSATTATANASAPAAARRIDADSVMSETPARGGDEHSVVHHQQQQPAGGAAPADEPLGQPPGDATDEQRNEESRNFFTSYLAASVGIPAGSHASVRERVALPNGTVLVRALTVRLVGTCSTWKYDVGRNKIDRPAIAEAYKLVCARPKGPTNPFVETTLAAARKKIIPVQVWGRAVAMTRDEFEVFDYGSFPKMPTGRAGAADIVEGVRHLNYVEFELMDPASDAYKADKLANHEQLSAVISAHAAGCLRLWTPKALRDKQEQRAAAREVIDGLHRGERFQLETRVPCEDNNGAMREAWATLCSSALGDYADATPDEREQIALLVFAIPRMHLRVLKGATTANQRDKHLRQQLSGMVCEQISSVEKERPAAALAAETMDPEAAFDDKCVRRAHKIIASTGHVGRGAAVLKRPFVKDPKLIHERVQVLLGLHPKGAVPSLNGFSETDYYTMDNIDCNGTYMKWLQGNLSGTAAGCDGWTFELMYDFLSRRPQALRHWLALMCDLCNGNVTREVRRLCAASWLVATGKPCGGTRPLAMGSGISKSAQAISVRAAAPLLQTIFSKTQFGMEEGGVHKVIVHMRAFLRDGTVPFTGGKKFGPRRCLGAVDVANAFNECHRQSMADVAVHVHQLQGIFKTCYQEHGDLHVVGMPGTIIKSERGARQGTGDGPAFYSLVAHYFGVSQVRNFRTKAGNAVHILLFLDDAYCLAESIEDLDEAVAFYTEQLGKAGLRVKPEKCEVLFCCDPAAVVPPEPSSLAKFRTVQTIKVLGASVGRDDESESVHLLAREKGRNVDFFRRLAMSVSPQSAAMLFFCAVPILSHVIATHHPSVSREMSQHHDSRLLLVLTTMAQCGMLTEAQIAAAMAPKNAGGMGLTSSEAIAPAAYASTLAMVFAAKDGAKRIPQKVLATALWSDKLHLVRANSPLAARMLDDNREQGALAGLTLANGSVSSSVFSAYLRVVLCAPSYLAMGQIEIPCPGTSCTMKLKAAPDFADHTVNCVRVKGGGTSRSHDALVTYMYQLLCKAGHMPAGDGTRKGEPRDLKAVVCGCGATKMTQEAFAAHKAAGNCIHAAGMKVHRTGPDLLCDSPNGERVLYDVTIVSKHNKTHEGKSTSAIMDMARDGKEASYAETARDANATLKTLVALSNGVLGREMVAIINAAADRMMTPRHELRRLVAARIGYNTARNVLAAEQMAGIAPPQHGISALAGRPVVDEAPLTQEERSPRRVAATDARAIITDVVAILSAVLGVDLRDLADPKISGDVVKAAARRRDEEAAERRARRADNEQHARVDQAFASGSPQRMAEAIMARPGTDSRADPVDHADRECFDHQARTAAATSAALAHLAQAREAASATDSAIRSGLDSTTAALSIQVEDETRALAALGRQSAIAAEHNMAAARQVQAENSDFCAAMRTRATNQRALYAQVEATRDRHRDDLEAAQQDMMANAERARAAAADAHTAFSAARTAVGEATENVRRDAAEAEACNEHAMRDFHERRRVQMRAAHAARGAVSDAARLVDEKERVALVQEREREARRQQQWDVDKAAWEQLERAEEQRRENSARAAEQRRATALHDQHLDELRQQRRDAEERAAREAEQHERQQAAERTAQDQRTRAARAQQGYQQQMAGFSGSQEMLEHERRIRSESAAVHRANADGQQFDQHNRDQRQLEHTQMRRGQSQHGADQRALAHERAAQGDASPAITFPEPPTARRYESQQMEHTVQRRADISQQRVGLQEREEQMARVHDETGGAQRAARRTQPDVPELAKQQQQQQQQHAHQQRDAPGDEADDPLNGRTTGGVHRRLSAAHGNQRHGGRPAEQQPQQQQQQRTAPTHRNPASSYTAPAAAQIARPVNTAGQGLIRGFDAIADAQRDFEAHQNQLAVDNAERAADGRTPLRRENGVLLPPQQHTRSYSPTAGAAPGGSFLGAVEPYGYSPGADERSNHNNNNPAAYADGGIARGAQQPALPSTVFPSTTTQLSTLGHVERSGRSTSAAPSPQRQQHQQQQLRAQSSPSRNNFTNNNTTSSAFSRVCNAFSGFLPGGGRSDSSRAPGWPGQH